jgi:hypothetical protein
MGILTQLFILVVIVIAIAFGLGYYFRIREIRVREIRVHENFYATTPTPTSVNINGLAFTGGTSGKGIEKCSACKINYTGGKPNLTCTCLDVKATKKVDASIPIPVVDGALRTLSGVNYCGSGTALQTTGCPIGK